MTNLYGLELDLEEVDDGIVTDVVVLSREIRYNKEGEAEEALLISATPSTTPMLMQGMANELMLKISQN